MNATSEDRVTAEAAGGERHDTDDTHRENSPLLPNGGTQPARESREEFTTRNLIIIVLLILTILLLEFGGALGVAPTMKVWEDIICRNYGVPSDRCGDNTEVQAEIALLRGWASPLALIPGWFIDCLTDMPQDGLTLSPHRSHHGRSVRFHDRQVR